MLTVYFNIDRNKPKLKLEKRLTLLFDNNQ